MYTGLRVGELAALKTSDIDGHLLTVSRTEIRFKDENRHYVFAVRGNTKGHDGIRQVVLPNEALTIIRQIRRLNPFGEYLFQQDGKRVLSKLFTNHLKKICRNVGIRPRSIHKLRKTYCIKLLRAGIDEKLITRQMGHTDITTSKRFYYYDDYENEEAINAIQSAVGEMYGNHAVISGTGKNPRKSLCLLDLQKRT